jgi:hypothetical protein
MITNEELCSAFECLLSALKITEDGLVLPPAPVRMPVLDTMTLLSRKVRQIEPRDPEQAYLCRLATAVEDSMTIVDLSDLCDALSSIPDLPEAACRSLHDLFDSQRPQDISEAITVCGLCREQAACREWGDSLPMDALVGVVAGIFHPPRRGQ